MFAAVDAITIATFSDYVRGFTNSCAAGRGKDVNVKNASCFTRLPRKVVTTTELTRILARRIRRVPDANGALRRVFRLTQPDENGCNWIPEFASAPSSTALYLLLAEARSEFNLKDE